MRFEATSRLIFAFALAVIALAAGAPALAQKPEERRWCDGEDAATADQRITGCSAVIRAGRDRSEKLAEAFNNRGLAYRLKGDLERAIQDYGQAIKIYAKFADAYNNRGVAYDKRGEYDRAIQDYDQSLKLKPSAEAHFNRGNAHLGKSRVCRRHRRLQPGDQAASRFRRSPRQPLLGSCRRRHPQAGARRLQ